MSGEIKLPNPDMNDDPIDQIDAALETESLDDSLTALAFCIAERFSAMHEDLDHCRRPIALAESMATLQSQLLGMVQDFWYPTEHVSDGERKETVN